MAFDTYLQMDGIKGESTDDKHKDWSEIIGFSHGMTQPVSNTKSSSGGGSSGRTQHGDLVLYKYLDSASPKLYEAISNGKHFGKVKVECCRAGGNQVKFLEINMEEVMVSKVQLGTNGSTAMQWEYGKDQTNQANQNQQDHMPIEEIHLNYGKIEWIYTQQKRKDGSGGGNITAKYDLTSNK